MKRKTTPEQEELFCQTCAHYDNDHHHNQTEYCYANCLNCKGYDGYHPRANYNNMLEDEHKKTLYICQKLMEERKIMIKNITMDYRPKEQEETSIKKGIEKFLAGSLIEICPITITKLEGLKGEKKE